MAWIESHTTLREHPKTKRLCRLLGINRREAIGLLHILWWWALDFAPEGDLSDLSDEDIADSIDWEGDAGQLMAALTEAGFIDGDRQIHDWDEFAEKWIARRRANAERMRLARASRKGDDSKGSQHVQSTFDARALQKSKSVGLPDQPDQPTNRTVTPPPTPYPASGEGDAADAAGKKRRGGRRNGSSHDEPSAEPLQAPGVTPVTTRDREVWNLARAAAAEGLSNGNAEALGMLVPLGRAADGGLHLRAPPGLGLGKFTNHVVRALLDAGDEHAAQVAIVEGRPGESEG